MENNIDPKAVEHKEFRKGKLPDDTLHADPFEQFAAWFEEALEKKVPQPDAVHLCTLSGDGFPQARVVYMRNYDEEGLVFYTNYNSEKGQNIAANPKASMNFFWGQLERQVRIIGTVERVPEEISDTYFNNRPRGSKIGAWASDQSTPIDGREVLENRVKHFEERFAGQEVPRPPHWGGYVLKPVSYEFWQGRPSRLHDRILFTKEGEEWATTRLCP